MFLEAQNLQREQKFLGFQKDLFYSLTQSLIPSPLPILITLTPYSVAVIPAKRHMPYVRVPSTPLTMRKPSCTYST